MQGSGLPIFPPGLILMVAIVIWMSMQGCETASYAPPAPATYEGDGARTNPYITDSKSDLIRAVRKAGFRKVVLERVDLQEAVYRVSFGACRFHIYQTPNQFNYWPDRSDQEFATGDTARGLFKALREPAHLKRCR